MDEKMPVQRLLSVQNVDLRILDLESEVAAIPLKVRKWDAALTTKSAELEEIKAKVDEIKKEQRHFERELEQKQVNLSKYNAQLPLIKTNREYKAILVEIDTVEKEISDIEEEILTKMTEVEEIEVKATAKREEVAQAEQEAKEEKDKLEQKRRELEGLLEGSRSERDHLISDVDAALLGQYDRIRSRKGGLALSHIDDESCGACHMALPPQLVNEVIGGKIKSCPSCNRLLYWNEE
jgi:predicted  nucleic acid-binding Zn-ribbon protein